MNSLSTFFETQRALLCGEIDVQTAEARLGTSPSGSDALDFYRVLAARNFAKILRELFSTVRAACRGAEPGLWERLVSAYSATRPAPSHDPNEFGRLFPSWVARQREAQVDLPPGLDELADWDFSRHSVSVAPDPSDLRSPVSSLHARWLVRMYARSIPEIAAALHGGHPPDVSEKPTLIVLYRSLHDHRTYHYRPTLPELRILERIDREGPGIQDAEASLQHAALALVTRGVLTTHEVNPC